MNRVLIFVEGQAEKIFIQDVLRPHLQNYNIFPIATLAKTKRVRGNTPDFKGGVVSYGKVKNDLLRLLQDSNASLITSMIDFYGLPKDFPGYATVPVGSCFEQVDYLEQAFYKDINHPKFLPFLMLHEFEAMLFVSPEKIAQEFSATSTQLEALMNIKSQFKSPEEINDNPKTAPSKRLLTLFPNYQKPLYGPWIVAEIGLELIRQECKHFNTWLQKLESLSTGTNI